MRHRGRGRAKGVEYGFWSGKFLSCCAPICMPSLRWRAQQWWWPSYAAPALDRGNDRRSGAVLRPSPDGHPPADGTFPSHVRTAGRMRRNQRSCAISESRVKSGGLQGTPRASTGGAGSAPQANTPKMPPRRTWTWFVIALILNYALVRLIMPAPDAPVTVPYTLFKDEVAIDN